MKKIHKYEILKDRMLKAQEAYKNFIESHSEPMTEEEIKESEAYSSIFSSPLDDGVEEKTNNKVVLKTEEDIRMMIEVQNKMHETYNAFIQFLNDNELES